MYRVQSKYPRSNYSIQRYQAGNDNSYPGKLAIIANKHGVTKLFTEYLHRGVVCKQQAQPKSTDNGS